MTANRDAVQREAESAEFLGIMSRDTWLAGQRIRRTRDRRRRGSGLATMVAAMTLPDADIMAVEPSLALRAVLGSRSRPGGRVTVLDSDVQHATLPPASAR